MLTWNQIAAALAAAAGAVADIVHVPSDAIAAAGPDWGAGLLGDKAHSMVLGNTKLCTVVPGYQPAARFEQGARERGKSSPGMTPTRAASASTRGSTR